jgi:predicted cobalt transporter CbtA
MKPYLLRGALAGVAGGLASVLALLLLGEPSIRRAIELEEANAVPGEVHEELFSRSTQVVGGALGLVLYGVFVGLVFGVVYAAARHRLGAGAEWQRARRLSVVAFVAVHLVPFLRYPANPPAVGNPDTINERTIAYTSLLVLSVLAVVLAGAVRDHLRRRGTTEPVAQLVAVATWLVVVGVAYLALPSNPDEITIPADLLWSFRVASLAGQAAFWAVTGAVFGLLGTRAVARRADAATVEAPPGTSTPTSPLA